MADLSVIGISTRFDVNFPILALIRKQKNASKKRVFDTKVEKVREKLYSSYLNPVKYTVNAEDNDA